MTSPRHRTPLALAALAAVVVVGCGSTPEHYQGAVLQQPVAKPAVTLTGTDGRPFTLTTGTAGKATLVFFGYSHCPDVCPTVMADTAAALAKVPAAVRAKVQVVFVGTDPDRDTVPVLHDYLARFDPGFLGLTGTYPQVKALADQLLVGLTPPEREPDGSIGVSHGAQVLGFVPGGSAPVYWLPGEGTQLIGQLTHDLPLLVAGATA